MRRGEPIDSGMPSEGLGMRVTQSANTAELSLLGELDIGRAAEVERELDTIITGLAAAADLGARRLVIDLRRLSFIDSSGIRVLLAARRSCAMRGLELSIVLGDSQVRRALTVAGLVEYLGIDR